MPRGSRGLLRARYLSDVSNEEWAFILPYLALCRERDDRRGHSMRAIFNAVRYVVSTGIPWTMMPNDLPPWAFAYRQVGSWIEAGCFEILAEDIHLLLREYSNRVARSASFVSRSHIAQSARKAGAWKVFDDAGWRKKLQTRAAAEMIGLHLSFEGEAVHEDDRARIADLSRVLSEIAGERVELAHHCLDSREQGSAAIVSEHGIHLEAFKHAGVSHGFVFLPRRWLVEPSFTWAARMRRLAREYERWARPWKSSVLTNSYPLKPESSEAVLARNSAES